MAASQQSVLPQCRVPGGAAGATGGAEVLETRGIVVWRPWCAPLRRASCRYGGVWIVLCAWLCPWAKDCLSPDGAATVSGDVPLWSADIAQSGWLRGAGGWPVEAVRTPVTITRHEPRHDPGHRVRHGPGRERSPPRSSGTSRGPVPAPAMAVSPRHAGGRARRHARGRATRRTGRGPQPGCQVPVRTSGRCHGGCTVGAPKK